MCPPSRAQCVCMHCVLSTPSLHIEEYSECMTRILLCKHISRYPFDTKISNLETSNRQYYSFQRVFWFFQ